MFNLLAMSPLGSLLKSGKAGLKPFGIGDGKPGMGLMSLTGGEQKALEGIAGGMTKMGQQQAQTPQAPKPSGMVQNHQQYGQKQQQAIAALMAGQGAGGGGGGAQQMPPFSAAPQQGQQAAPPHVPMHLLRKQMMWG